MKRAVIIYRGIPIFRNLAPGFALRWHARIEGHGRLSADTLVGIRSLIRDVLER